LFGGLDIGHVALSLIDPTQKLRGGCPDLESALGGFAQ
jgi:hypothetical protein